MGWRWKSITHMFPICLWITAHFMEFLMSIRPANQLPLRRRSRKRKINRRYWFMMRHMTKPYFRCVSTCRQHWMHSPMIIRKYSGCVEVDILMVLDIQNSRMESILALFQSLLWSLLLWMGITPTLQKIWIIFWTMQMLQLPRSRQRPTVKAYTKK